MVKECSLYCCRLLIFVIDALKGVQFLHENNIVHRDLTAANVFITASGQVKLSGLMQARRPSGDTIRGQVHTSYSFSSPVENRTTVVHCATRSSVTLNELLFFPLFQCSLKGQSGYYEHFRATKRKYKNQFRANLQLHPNASVKLTSCLVLSDIYAAFQDFINTQSSYRIYSESTHTNLCCIESTKGRQRLH